MATDTKSLSSFAARFANELKPGKSQVCSPLSTQVLLAMLALGSREEMRAQLMRTLELSDDEEIRSLFSHVTTAMKSVEGITLKMANKVFVMKRSPLKEHIQKDAEEVFESAIEQLDFTKKKAAADVINKWVEEQTNNLIKNIVEKDNFDVDTKVVLVNAIYFQGLWEVKFREKDTQNKPFHVSHSKEIQVPMMWKRGCFQYNHSLKLKAKILEMFYEGRQASMVVVLPDDVDGLGDLMKQLADGRDLMMDLVGLEATRLDVTIPKFKTETELELIGLLDKIGIHFNSKIIDMLLSNEPLHVTKATQKAFIQVDECGTEAAACTVVIKKIIKRAKDPPQFIANHPFLYILKIHQIPVFVGVYHGNDIAKTDVPSESENMQQSAEADVTLDDDELQKLIAAER